MHDFEESIEDKLESKHNVTVRYIQKVTSDSLIIKDMGKYLGKQVEIIIFPLDQAIETDANAIIPPSMLKFWG